MTLGALPVLYRFASMSDSLPHITFSTELIQNQFARINFIFILLKMYLLITEGFSASFIPSFK